MELEKFKITVVPLREKLINYSLKLTKDRADAEDIVQEAFLRLWYMRNKLDSYRNIDALAVQVVKNLCIDALRAKKTNAGEEVLSGKTGGINLELQIEQQDAVAQIRLIIETLPSLQQTIIRMKDVEGYELNEIAQITASNIEAVRVNLSRARKKVREQFFKLNGNEK